jgi:hypothetical protein
MMEFRNDGPDNPPPQEPIQSEVTDTKPVEIVKEEISPPVNKEAVVVEEINQPIVEQIEETKTEKTSPQIITIIEDVLSAQPKDLPPETEEFEAIVVVPEEIGLDSTSSSSSSSVGPVPSRKATKVIVPDEHQPDQPPTVVVVEELATNILPSHTSSSSSSSSSSSNIVENLPSGNPDVVIEIHTDPITRQPTVVITPGAQSRRSSNVSRRQSEPIRRASKPTRRTTFEVPAPKFIARHPHLGRIVLKILRWLGISDQDAMVKVVHWGLYEWK